MNVINRKTLKSFYIIHPDAKEPLETWFRIAKKSTWESFNEVKELFPSADYVGDDRMVFNIKGNRYRLVVRFSFIYKVVQIKWFGTHSEYDKIDVLKV